MKKVLFTMLMLLICVSAVADQTFVCCVHKGEVLWVRDIPDKSGNMVGSIRYGYEVQVSEIKNLYAHVTLHDGKTGWVYVPYIEKPIKEEIWIVNTADPVNKRETPDGRYVTKITGGSRISVLGWRYSEKGELWAKVYHGGYVKAEFLSKAD